MLYTQWHWITTRNSKTIPWPASNGPPWPSKDIETTMMWLLVAWHARICKELCWWMCCLSTGKDKLTSDRPTSDAYQGLYNRMPLCPDLLQFHHQLANLWQFQLSHGYGRPWAFKGGNFMPQALQSNSFRTSTNDLACQIKAYPIKDPNLPQKSSRKWDAF